MHSNVHTHFVVDIIKMEGLLLSTVMEIIVCLGLGPNKKMGLHCVDSYKSA